MSETKSPTFTFAKDGVYYFSRRIPLELRRHYSSPRIAYSLRTKSEKIAEIGARRAADQLDEYWYHLKSHDAQSPGKRRAIIRSCKGRPYRSILSNVFGSPSVSLILGRKRCCEPIRV